MSSVSYQEKNRWLVPPKTNYFKYHTGMHICLVRYHFSLGMKYSLAQKLKKEIIV
jgi:hypothetical protein